MQQKIALFVLLVLLIVVALAISSCTAADVLAELNDPIQPNTLASSNVSLGKTGQSDGTAVQKTAPSYQTISDSGLRVGDIAFVIAPPDNIVRESPGLNSRRIGSYPAGTVLEIREGPVYANGMAWWRTYSHTQNLTGWTPDGAPTGSAAEQYLAPVIGRTVCADTYRTRLAVGSRAYVLADPPGANRIRSGAGTNFAVISQIQPNQRMQIIGGPLCAQNMVWWQVATDNNPQLRGWTSEGDWSNYFLAPLSIP